MEPGQIRILNAIMTTELDIVAQQAFARKEAKEEERRSIARKSLELGLSPETVSQITGLTVEEVRALVASNGSA